MTRQEKRDYINSLAEIELKPAKKKGFICPICGNGTGAKGTGITRIAGTNLYSCFGKANCFEGKDYLDILKLKHKAAKEDEIFAMYGLDGSESAPEPRRDTQKANGYKNIPKKQNASERVSDDFKAYYENAHKSLLSSDAAIKYLESRGISLDSIVEFNIGYDPAWINPANQAAKSSERIIIPRSDSSYLARALHNGDYSKMSAGRSCLFNAHRFEDAGKYGFVCVVEGELDAIALEQLGFAAIGLCSTSGKDRFIQAAKEAKAGAFYVLALDNDKAGGLAQSYIAEKLSLMGISYIDADRAALYGEHNDPAQTAKEDKTGFIERMGQIYSRVLQIKQEMKEAEQLQEELRNERTSTGILENFLEVVQTNRFEPISTEFPALDRKLGGGFLKQSLVMLAAAPAAGKTAFAQQIFEGIAQNGDRNVLFINLEMSREQLMARSLSRIAYGMGERITAPEILQGYQWTNQQKNIVYNAAEVFKDVSSGIVYNPDDITPDIDSILDYIEREAESAERSGSPAPIVVIDYLQLLAGKPKEDIQDSIKRALFGLKKYAISHDTIVFCILASNRESNKSGKITLESGRDTSAIEYTADVFLGLYYEDAENLDAQPRDIVLDVLKSRFSGLGKMKLKFYSAYSTFIAVDTAHSLP